MTRRCVVLFARSPKEEARLKRVRSAEPLFEYTRRRVAAAVARMPGVDLLICSSSEAERLRGAARRIPQRGAGFEQRLSNAFADAKQLGYSQIVAVGTDSPGLGGRQITAAFSALKSKPAVFGRAADGGVYLIGLACPAEGLFAGVPWRTPRVCARLVANAPGCAVLDERLGEIDSEADLHALCGDPALSARAAELLASLLALSPTGKAADVALLPTCFPSRSSLVRGPPLPSAAFSIC